MEPTYSRFEENLPDDSCHQRVRERERSNERMNVLWVTNGALPETNALTAKDLPQGGSWLVNMARALSQEKGMSLSIAFSADNATIPRRIQGRSVVYYPFQREATSRARRTHLAAVTLRTAMLESNPDLVHIFGTESNLADEAIAVSRSLGIKTIVSIQGLVSYIAEHYFAGVLASVVERRTFRDRLRRDSLNQQRDKFVRRGLLEEDLLRRADYVVGRTEWDHACHRLVSPDCQYRVCNETLRESFYASQWFGIVNPIASVKELGYVLLFVLPSVPFLYLRLHGEPGSSHVEEHLRGGSLETPRSQLRQRSRLPHRGRGH